MKGSPRRGTIAFPGRMSEVLAKEESILNAGLKDEILGVARILGVPFISWERMGHS